MDIVELRRPAPVGAGPAGTDREFLYKAAAVAAAIASLVAEAVAEKVQGEKGEREEKSGESDQPWIQIHFFGAFLD